MANYNFFVNGSATASGTLTATFVAGPPASLTNVSYTNAAAGSQPQPHSDIALTGPDGSGNYTASKRLTRDFAVTGHNAHKHISFTFNPNSHPEFSNGQANDNPGRDGGFTWTAAADSHPLHHKH